MEKFKHTNEELEVVKQETEKKKKKELEKKFHHRVTFTTHLLVCNPF